MAISTQKPNVIFVITDDQGYGDLGCTGNPILKTPNIDNFYNESIRLQNFHVGPTCAPTRAGILTGHYANSTGVWHTIGGRSLLRQDEVTIADALRSNGYRTGIFGKWHLGDNYPYRPQDRGFDEVVVHGGGGISQTPDYWGNDYFDDTYSVNGELKKFDGYCTDVWFNEAINFVENNREQPFFCYIASNAPHSPYNVEARYSDPYKHDVYEDRANFYGMIANIDENFGRLRKKLHELALEDNTILIFMTDNGSSEGATLDEQGYVLDGYNAGMRGMKGSQYDGGHRVPVFIRWPDGGLAEKRPIDTLTANVDLMPTLLDLCGAQDEELSFHGQSIRPLLYDNGEAWPERTLVTDSQRLTNPVKWRKSAVMTDRWRLIDGIELYDINNDLEQRHDIAAEHADVVQALRKEYDKWWEIVSVQFERDIPISIGSDNEPSVKLTCHDWRNEESDCPWHQGMIRQAYEAQGYWEVKIEKAGDYTFELRRWPPETSHMLTSGIEGNDITWRRDVISERNASWYSGGVAMDITQAHLKVYMLGDTNEIQQSAPIDPVSTKAVFQAQLAQGSAHISAYFDTTQGRAVGAYYVLITPVS